MPIITRTIKASTVKGYTLEPRISTRGWWIFKASRPVMALVEHRRTTYAIENVFKPIEPPTITTVNESADVLIFEDDESPAAIHTLAHYNAQIDDNELYSSYQHS